MTQPAWEQDSACLEQDPARPGAEVSNAKTMADRRDHDPARMEQDQDSLDKAPACLTGTDPP
jgi:hypothetical protein